MTPNIRARMLLVVPTLATERRVLEMPRYESLDSERGHGLGCFRALLLSLIFEAAVILSLVLCWMLRKHE